jgi:ABC-type transport system involved in cytochrome bd biosynthesis fused ATPase/permease subunit
VPVVSLDVPQEPPASIESNRPPAYWPSSTANDSFIVVENLVVKYAPELPAVLDDVSFTLKASERVGLVGPTGMSYVYVFLFSNSHILRREWQVDTCYEHAALCKDILGFLSPTA